MTPTSAELITCIVASLRLPDEKWRARAHVRLNTLTKPLGSLGKLEELAAQLVAIHRQELQSPLRKAVYVFAADHGVTDEGVSAYPSEVTHQMVLNFLTGGAAVSVLARAHGVALHVVDVGVDADFEGVAGLLHHKVRRGTRNLMRSAAMTDEELAQALQVGVKLAAGAAETGHTLLAVGEMGIGNTTSASAITCALTGAAAPYATGRGTGLDDAAFRRKIVIVDSALQLHFAHHASSHPLEVLRCVGGLEIAAMTGMILAAAGNSIAIVIDGFISAAAAAIAVALEPRVRGYLIAGHRSQEPGHGLLLEFLQLSPILDLQLRLGEGSGAVLAMPVIESAIALYTQMATFSSATVSEAYA